MIRHMHRLLKSSEGSVVPLVAVGMLVMVAATGTAVDMGRATMVQARLSQALDAAGLAAGATVSTSEVSGEVTKFMNANYPSGYMGSTLTSVNTSVNEDNSIIDLSATATMETTLVKVMGINSITISAVSQITREAKGMELVLVIDTTGSMDDSAGGGISKMQAAKNAANSLLNILYGSDTEIDDLWVGMVPFAQAVNIGTSRSAWTTADTFNWGPTSWMGCVDAREASNRDTTDDPPSVATFPKYYWPCSESYNGWYGNDTDNSHNDCDTGNNGHFGYRTPLSTSRGPNKYCSQAVTPLTASKSTVVSAINSLDTNGNTHIVLGAVWAWRMLSPRWQGLWGGEMDTNNLPLAYNTPLMNKVVVLMTDGDNTISNSSRGAYWYLSNGKLGTTSQSTAESRLNTRTGNVCTSMKNNGIIIYTVAFGTSIGTTAQNMLRNCASRTDYYFYSPTSADLQTAFQVIGDSLANLRISE